MAVYRVNKNRGYTVMANFHLRDKNLSLKAVGLLSKMLSFNDGWKFSTRLCLRSARKVPTLFSPRSEKLRDMAILSGIDNGTAKAD
ncbi:MAG: hypothetical protein V8Q82_04070 [Christensenellales bacterium]